MKEGIENGSIGEAIPDSEFWILNSGFLPLPSSLSFEFAKLVDINYLFGPEEVDDDG